MSWIKRMLWLNLQARRMAMRTKIQVRAAYVRAAAKAALTARTQAAAPPVPDVDYYVDLAKQVSDLATGAVDAIGPLNGRTAPAGYSKNTVIDYAWSQLNSAWLRLIELQPDDQLAGSVPDILATVVNLGVDDPRRVAVERRWPGQGGAATDSAATLTAADRSCLAAALEAGFEAAAESRDALRRFVRMLTWAALGFAVVLGCFTAVAVWKPEALPLCVGKGKLAVCPSTSGHKATRGDIPLIELLGIVGAAMAGARALSGMAINKTSDFSVPVGQALLKLFFGAATAVVGTLFVTAGLIPAIKPTTPVEILSYAVIFGYAQQILTGLIDQRANALLSDASSKTAAGAASSPSSPGTPGP
jgi:hypothetical protein